MFQFNPFGVIGGINQTHFYCNLHGNSNRIWNRTT